MVSITTSFRFSTNLEEDPPCPYSPQRHPHLPKEDSDTTQHIARLKELQNQATGKVKDDIAREITLASYGEVGGEEHCL